MTDDPSSNSSQELRLTSRIARRLDWHWQPHRIAGRCVELALAADPDALLVAACRQQAITGADEATLADPFWAQTWPAAAALDWYFQRHIPPPGFPVLELGCGSGAGGMAALLRGARVTFTDGASEPLLLLRQSLRKLAADVRNRSRVHRLRFGLDQISGPRFPLVVASDITYLRNCWRPLLQTLQSHLAVDGQAILADPYRSVSDEFCDWATEQGWYVQQTAIDDFDFRVRIISLRPSQPDA